MSATTSQRAKDAAWNSAETPDLQGLVAAARLELRQSSYPSLRRVQCEADERRLVLTGEVGTYFLKQMAQTLVARLSPDVPIDNQVEVLP